MNDSMKAALTSDRGQTVTSFVALGKLLRSVCPHEVRKRAREAARNILADETKRAELLVAVPQRGDEAVEAAEAIVHVVEARAPLSPNAIASLALLRDDLQAMHVGVAVASVQGTRDEQDDLLQLDLLLSSYGRAVDRTVSPVVGELRRAWLAQPAEIAPAELLALVSTGANPWWLDVFDPLWNLLEPVGTERAPLDLAAATLDSGVSAGWFFERGLSATVDRKQDESSRLTLRGRALAGVSALEVVWVEGKKRSSAPLRRVRDDLWDGAIPSSVLDSPILYLVADGHVLVRDA
jgi:hypothetical protein